MNSKSKIRARIPDLEGADGLITEQDGERAKAFNEFFSSVFTKEDMQNVPVRHQQGVMQPLTGVDIEEDVLQLKKFKSRQIPWAGQYTSKSLTGMC